MMTEYQILGVTQNSTPQEIRNAYRKKAKQFHPDTSSNEDKLTNHLAMIRLNQAYKNIKNRISSDITIDLKTEESTKDFAYIHYKKGKDIYKNAVESNWFPSKIDNSDEANESVLYFLINELPKAYYEFSKVIHEYPNSQWAEDSRRIMRIIENMVPRYKKLLLGNKKNITRI